MPETNGGYWKGTVDQKLDRILDGMVRNEADHDELKEALNAEIEKREEKCDEHERRIDKVESNVVKILAVGSALAFIITTGIALAALL